MEYLDWLASVVLLKKANEKWRLCIDFTDINRACPKDSFPLPRIDLIVDATAGHELLSFMDAFLGYNQIRMDPNDQENTSFVTRQGTYSYQVMPFGLKNSGATYQRLVNKMFQKHIRTSMGIYIDDMLVKSVKAEKFLGFMVNSREIEANPDKIKVVLDIHPPSNTKEIQCLTRQVLKKAFHWEAQCEEALSTLKTYLSFPPALVSPS